MTRFSGAAALDAPLYEGAGLSQEACSAFMRRRWIVALALMAAASTAFLVGSLYGVMDRSIHFAVAPPLFRWDEAAHAGVASLREDRLTPERPASRAHEYSVRVEQLETSGLAMRPFTHLVADLAEMRPAQVAGASSGSSLVEPMEQGAQVGQTAPPVKKTALRLNAGQAPPPAGAPIGSPINVTPVVESPPAPPPISRVIIARKGDGLGTILRALGVAPARAAGAGALYARTGGAPSFSGGEKILVEAPGTADGHAPAPPFRIEVERSGAPAWIAARADSGEYALCARPPATAADAAVAMAAGQLRAGPDQSVRDSLRELATSRGVDRGLVDEIVRLAAHDFDLGVPVAASDRVEFLSTPGEAGPELRYVRLTVDGRTRQYYRFTAPDDGSVDYYDRNGRSVTKFLLRKPVPAGKLGDGFGWRMHPILKVRKFHEGVDYDAPMGSPVEAAGAGVVEKISWESGYGKYIRIRHDLGYETTYAHVSGFARGLHVGSRVRQGEVIAYVGSTGLSTGAHLYYEVRINGRNVDPLRIRLAGGRILKGAVLADFESRVARTDQLIAASPIATNRLAAGKA